MMRSTGFLIAVGLAIGGALVWAGLQSAEAGKIPGAQTGGRPLTAVLTGDNEVPPREHDGSGLAVVTLNPGQEECCFDISLAGFPEPPDPNGIFTGAHIHRGEAGVNGPVVINFFTVARGDDVEFTGCRPVDRDLARDIIQNPSSYYVNVHTQEFPGGSVRGQLSK